MAWIESHIDLGEHPKLIRLCESLMISKIEAVGLLTLLWHFAMKYAWRDGDLRRFTASTLAKAIGWDKDPEMMLRNLIECCWIDADLKVHDWLDYAGKLVNDRLYNEKRRKTPFYAVNPRKMSATNPTLPTNLTNQKTSSSADADAFTEFWKAYPRKIGKGAARKAWRRIPGVTALVSQMIASLAVQRLSDQWRRDNGQFIPHPATWLNQTRWEDEVEHSGFVSAPVFDKKRLEEKQEETRARMEREWQKKQKEIQNDQTRVIGLNPAP